MLLDTEPLGSWLIVRPVEPRLDAFVSDGLRCALESLVLAGHRSLVLDLAAVEFMDSAGLGALVAATQVVGDETTITIARPSGPVRLLLSLTRMDNVFRIVERVEDAEIPVGA